MILKDSYNTISYNSNKVMTNVKSIIFRFSIRAEEEGYGEIIIVFSCRLKNTIPSTTDLISR